MKLQSKNKILCIVQLPPPVHGSAVMNKHLVESKLIKHNFIIKILPLKFVNQLSDIGNFQFIKIVKMNIFMCNLLFQLIKFNPDLIYYSISLTGFAFYRDVLFIYIIKLFNKKIIYHLHSKGIKKKLKNKLNKVLYKFVFKNSYVIQLSPLLYHDIKDICPKENIFFCANGIKNKSIIIKKENDKNDKPKILYLSNMIKSKGILTLLDACKILNRKGFDFHCYFAGNWFNDITPDDFNKYLIKNNLNNVIEYLGPKYGKEKDKLLNSVDMLCFPTYYYNECFPLVLLEAMQFELPVISTYEGAIPEIVKDGKNGFLVPQKDSNALADKLKILIENFNLRKKMGKAGRKKFLDNYTLNKWEKRMLEIFNNVLYEN